LLPWQKPASAPPNGVDVSSQPPAWPQFLINLPAIIVPVAQSKWQVIDNYNSPGGNLGWKYTMAGDSATGFFGPNHDAVAEVMAFALSRHPWERSHNASTRDVLLVDSVEEAVAHFEDDESAYIDEVSEDAIDWQDLLENLECQFMTKIPQEITRDEWRVFVNRVLSFVDDIEGNIAKKLSWLPSELQSLTARLLDDCALCRAAIGKSSPFWEQVFEMLTAGGIPVAWKGHWPQGKMVVFFPRSLR
jgi:hypothetical protein